MTAMARVYAVKSWEPGATSESPICVQGPRVRLSSTTFLGHRQGPEMEQTGHDSELTLDAGAIVSRESAHKTSMSALRKFLKF